MLDGRKLKVLYAIINSHLISAEPIGSRTISKDYDLGVSPATIRNEMSDLEDKGYLNKPHSSSGRVPSDKAYRLYVDEILKINQPIKTKEKNKIQETLYTESKEVGELMENAAKLLSSITSYTAIAMSPQISKSKLKHIQLMKIDIDKILMVVVNSSGLVKNSVFKTNLDVSDREFIILSNYLNEKFKGLTIDEIISLIEVEGLDEHKNLGLILKGILPELSRSLKDVSEAEVYSEGVTKILNFPEYNDLEKVRSFISFIEDKDSIINMLSSKDEYEEYKGVSIVIGNENQYEEMKDCSLITADYKIDGNTMGKIGIIGPKRMEYVGLINTLINFSEDISSVLNKIIQ